MITSITLQNFKAFPAKVTMGTHPVTLKKRTGTSRVIERTQKKQDSLPLSRSHTLLSRLPMIVPLRVDCLEFCYESRTWETGSPPLLIGLAID
jgi:hypothetical protein